MDYANTVLVILLGVAVGLAAAAFVMRKTLGPRIGRMMGEAYKQKFQKQLTKNYPALAERLAEFEMTPESQEAFQSAMKRLPPQEGLKLQTEFNRLRENFMGRHPELAPLIAQAQAGDGRAQMKAMDQAMKLPAEQRAAIEKDVLWAWDQLRGRFPKLMGPLEAAFRKR